MAEIIVHTTRFRSGRVYHTYEWAGSPRETARISRYPLILSWERQLLPWPLKKVGWDGLGYVVARADGVNRLSCAWHTLKEKFQRTFGLVVYRLWLTLEVWNLAKLDDWTKPTWKNLRWFRKPKEVA